MENIFTLPGLYMLEALTLHTPGIAEFLGISDPSKSIALVVVLSALIWIFTIVGCWATVKFTNDIYRFAEAMIRTLWHRTTQSAGSVKTWVICRYRRIVPQRSSSSLEATSGDRFNDFDYAVLQAAAECGPGHSTSAAELASSHSLRPSQFQKSLGKLSNNQLLTTVIGSTDGFDNYRLTDYGAAYLQMWEARKTG